MKWVDDRRKTKKMIKMNDTIHSIRSQQVMQWLELINTSIEGLREIGVPNNDADRINHATFMRIFSESVAELEKYVDRFSIPEELCEYNLLISDKGPNEPNAVTDVKDSSNIKLYEEKAN